MLGRMRDMIRLGQVEPVRKRIAEATQALLGDTIALSNADWQAPTLLPGWSRAKVAQHLSRSADAMRRLALAASKNKTRALYKSDEERRAQFEGVIVRSGLDLQIDLDTTAGGLDEAFGLVTDWDAPVKLPVGTMPLSAVVVARLHEVVLHHRDLGTSHSPAQLDAVTASWLLQWAALWLRTKPGMPSVELQSESGVVENVGEHGATRTVTGSDEALWLWITGRDSGAALEGADGLTWPLLG